MLETGRRWGVMEDAHRMAPAATRDGERHREDPEAEGALGQGHTQLMGWCFILRLGLCFLGSSWGIS